MFGRRNSIQNAGEALVVGYKAKNRETLTGNGSTFTATLPTYSAGDVVVLLVKHESGAYIGTPSGWTLLTSRDSRYYLFGKLMTGSEGSTLAVPSASASPSGTVTLGLTYGAIIASPTATGSGSASNSNGGTVAVTVTPQFTGTGIYVWFGVKSSSTDTYTSSTSGAVERDDNNAAETALAAYDLFEATTSGSGKSLSSTNSSNSGTAYGLGCVLRVS
jgi:hypothetical protein